MPDNSLPINFTVSVSDSASLERVAKAITAQGAEIYAEGATLDALQAAGIQVHPSPGAQPAEEMQPEIAINLTMVQRLRYGENPHQEAALYKDDLPTNGPTLVGPLMQLQGIALSYNNLLDADVALALVRDYRMPAVAIVKHAGPCSIACGAEQGDLAEVFSRVVASDQQSAFGGVVGVNRPVDVGLAEQIARTRFDLIVAPDYSEEAVEILSHKAALGLLSVHASDTELRDDHFASKLAFRQISGGFLVQTSDSAAEPQMEPVTLRHPTLEEISDLTFAWKAIRHVRSNGIVLVRNLATVGIGAGQSNRIDAVRLAVSKAGRYARGAVMASDGFLPLPDSIEAASEAGATAIIQPGGSMSDDAVIEAADIAGLAMVFTGKRHLRH